MKKNGVEVLLGRARLDGPGCVQVAGESACTLRAPPVVLATGARPRVLPGLETDGERVWGYREALRPAAMPASLLVVGSGAIGVEFASFYRDLGCQVTLVETLPQILPAEDEEPGLVASLAQALAALGPAPEDAELSATVAQATGRRED